MIELLLTFLLLGGIGPCLLLITLYLDKIKGNKRAAVLINSGSNPYRTAAEVPQEQEKELPKPKKKREFKMPKLSKSVKTFMYLIPSCMSAVGIGYVYDSPIGTGIKFGMSAALALVGLFFIVSAINYADSKQV